MTFVLQPLGHIPAHDALSEPFDDGGLSHPGLTNQDRVVLGPPGKNLDDPSDLVVTADDGIDLSLARQLGQIAPILLEGLVGRLRVLARYPLTASNGLQDLENVVSRDAITLEESSCLTALFEDREKQVFYARVLVFHLFRLPTRLFQDLIEAARNV